MNTINKSTANENKTKDIDTGTNKKKNDTHPLEDKYQLDTIRRKEIREKLIKSIKNKELIPEGLVNSSTMQLHVLLLRSDHLDSKNGGNNGPLKESTDISVDSPFRVLDPASQQMDNDIYFRAIISATQWTRNYRIKIGYYPYIPRAIREEIIYHNRLSLVGRTCDKTGNCLYIYRYQRYNLKTLLDQPVE